MCLAVAGEMLALAGIHADAAAALDDGRALEVWDRMVRAQGGDPDAPLPQAARTEVVPAPRGGVVTGIDALAVGNAAWALGAGRAQQHDDVDPAAGVVLALGVGDTVRAGAPLCTLHAADDAHLAAGRAALTCAFAIGDTAAEPVPVVLSKVS